MNLEPDDLQEGLADAARSLLSRESDPTKLVDRGDPSPLHDRIWRQAADQGWLALGLAEDDGGLGLGLPEQVMVFRELGRFATPGPFLSSTLSALLAAQAGEHALAASIGSGDLPVGSVVAGVAVNLRADGLALRLDVSGAELVELDGVAPTPSTDPHTPTATFAGASGGLRQDGPELISRARVLAAAELLGIIEAVRDMSADYAKVRQQFGRPIGSFQAVKHRCADMAIAAVAAVGQVYQAALMVEAGHPDAAFHAASAYVLASQGAYRSAADNIQNLGGIGFTWEHPAHLYVKRTVALTSLIDRRAVLDAVMAPARHEFR